MVYTHAYGHKVLLHIKEIKVKKFNSKVESNNGKHQMSTLTAHTGTYMCIIKAHTYYLK